MEIPRRVSATVLSARIAWIAPALYLIIGGGLIGGVGQAIAHAGTADQLPTGSASAAVARLDTDFRVGTNQTAVVLFWSDHRLDGAARSAITAAFRRAGGSAAPPSLVASANGDALYGVIPVKAAGDAQVRAAVDRLRTVDRTGLPAGVHVGVTGPAAVQADLANVFSGADITLLAVTAAVVALLLIITYRSPILWVIPLVVVGIADQIAAVAGTHLLSALHLAFDGSTTGILSVLVFGAGTDYALLLISRYRDELRLHESRPVAMERAWRRTAEAVTASATTVFVSLLTLLLSAFPTTRSLGVACAVGIAVAAAAVLLVLPPTLVLMPRGIFWPRRPEVGQTVLSEGRSFWRRVADTVGARPVGAMLVAAVIVAALATGVTGIRSGLSTADQFIKPPESVTTATRLAHLYPAGTSDPAVVVTRADAGAVVRTARSVAGVASAVVTGRHAAQTRINVVLSRPSGTAAAQADIATLRRALARYPHTDVGGTDAQELDTSAATTLDRERIIPLILVLVLLALGLFLRSVVAPFVLVGTVVATYLAALGAGWLISSQVFGFPRFDLAVPLQAFIFLVALGVDYNIFLVVRAREETHEHGHREGILRAVASTGGVITSAGILLAAVFAVLGVLPLVVLAELGIVICVGVLIDTLIVRTVLVPAIAVLLGDRFWWPGRRRSP